MISSQFPNTVADLPRLDVAKSPSSDDFGEALTVAIEHVNELQDDADRQVQNLLQGKEQDVHGALIAVEKADIGFQLMMQVRNKVVNAYQEVARMQF